MTTTTASLDRSPDRSPDRGPGLPKKVTGVHGNPHGHWVGDGFPVHTLFSYDRLGAELSPFLMLDHAGPHRFEPAARPRGVGTHPHRGFETVTIVYRGEVSHQDSTGGGGTIGPGDVQWMTAGAGIVHEEFHSHEFTRRGGEMEMVQLWVNLPRAHKMTPAGYQGITAGQIPSVALPDGAGTLRLIAGRHGDVQGPARTFTPIEVWDIRLAAGRRTTLALPEGHQAAVVVLHGRARVNTQANVPPERVVVMDRSGTSVELEAGDEDTTLLLLAGAPIEEPIVGYGPFVMTSRDEIVQAIDDFNAGRFGRIAAPTA